MKIYLFLNHVVIQAILGDDTLSQEYHGCYFLGELSSSEHSFSTFVPCIISAYQFLVLPLIRSSLNITKIQTDHHQDIKFQNISLPLIKREGTNQYNELNQSIIKSLD